MSELWKSAVLYQKERKKERKKNYLGQSATLYILPEWKERKEIPFFRNAASLEIAPKMSTFIFFVRKEPFFLTSKRRKHTYQYCIWARQTYLYKKKK